jgi:DNA-binding response OmpR family regulator
MKILLIEDEVDLSNSIRDFLQGEGYVCECAFTYFQAEDLINNYTYDCILLDLMLPGGSGLDLIPEIKKKKTQEGLIILSAKDSVDDRIKGLNLGADDYLSKPFHLAELNARIKSLFRRRKLEGNEWVLFNEIAIDSENREVKVNDKIVVLTSKEYELLLFFITNKNRVIPKDTLVEHIWGNYMDQSDSLDFIYTHIKNMRKKIIEAGGNDYLKTVYGIGYKFTADY